MKFILKIALLTLLYSLLSCDGISRFDPIEASDYLLRIDSFYFINDTNNPTLSDWVQGYVDNDNKEIYAAFPPSIDITGTDFTASFSISSDGPYNNYFGEYDKTRNWEGSSTLEINRSLVDPEWTGGDEFYTRYDVYVERYLTSSIWFSGDTYTNIASLDVYLYFNDEVSGKGDLTDFSSGFSGTNYTIDVVSPVETSDSQVYNLTITPTSEGAITIGLNANSFYDSSSVSYGNIESNTANAIYDATPPITSLTPITVSGLANSTVEDMNLTISFPQSTDTYTNQSQLLYSFYFTVNNMENMVDLTTTQSQTPLDYNDSWENSYRSSYTWAYGDLPTEITDELTSGTNINFNVVVRDLGYNYEAYNDTYITPDNS